MVAVTALALYGISRVLESSLFPQEETRGNLAERGSGSAIIEYGGARYAYKTGLETVLFIGVDQASDTGAGVGNFRNGGQADFLLLLLIDSAAKTVTRLQIDRDTMAEITVLGVLGNNTGTRLAQICLSHGFGDGKAQSGRFTAEAVQRLLYGIPVDSYITLNLDAIPVLNDAVGGVTVTLSDDFSAYDPAMRAGETLTLTGKQAELFVRSRLQVGDGSNAARMVRQQAYLSALMDAVGGRIAENAGYAGTLYDLLGDSLTTDMNRGKMINVAYKASGYEVSEMITLSGEHRAGSDGFMEFHADTQALEALVIDLFYRQVP